MHLAAVGQAGERIKIRQFMNTLFNHLTFGDVGHNNNQTLNFVILIADSTDTRPAGADFATGPLVENFTLPVAGRHQSFADFFKKGDAVTL